MSEEDAANLLALVLALRPERLQGLAIQLQPEEVRAAAAQAANAVAPLALAEPASLPSVELRARILHSLTTIANRGDRREALVIVDMLNDHLTPGSVLEVARARDIVPALAARIEAARKTNTPVVYVVDNHEPDDSDLDAWGVHAVAGSQGAEVWPALAPQPGDHVVHKPSYSGFFSSKLESVLRELRVDTLTLTGCSTEVQLFATATDALQKGFALEVPVELQAGLNESAEQHALAVMNMLLPYKPAREALLASY